MRFVNADCAHVAIENPIGVMNTCYRQPDQTIHPYMFENDTKINKTHAVKRFKPFTRKRIPKPDNHGGRPNGGRLQKNVCGKRSKTFPGIACNGKFGEET